MRKIEVISRTSLPTKRNQVVSIEKRLNELESKTWAEISATGEFSDFSEYTGYCKALREVIKGELK